MQNHRTLTIDKFDGGLDLTSDEENLELNQTALMQNCEIRSSGIRKMPGWKHFVNALPPYIHLHEAGTYRLPTGQEKFIVVAYPDIYIVDSNTGNFEYAVDTNGIKFEGWISTGRPYARQVGDFCGLTDGVNEPILIGLNTVYAPNWVPSYSHANNAEPTATEGSLGNLNQSYLATGANPTGSDIGNPSISVFHKNRWILNDVRNPRRLYFSKASDFKIANFAADMFEDNDPDEFNIAFYVDVPCSSDIVGAEVVSSDVVIVYCKSEILILKGNHPPGIGYPQPHFDFDPLNQEIGAIAQQLIVKKGDNDHYFIASDNTVQQISSIDESLQVKPKGVSNNIYPILRDLKPETLARGFLANHRINSELYFAFPSTNQLRYPDVAYILNYSDGNISEPPWSKFAGFKEMQLRGLTTINDGKDMFAFSPEEIYQVGSGISIAGAVNKSAYQLAGLDFRLPKNNKRIIDITLYASSSTGATLNFFHLWQDGSSGSSQVTIPKDEETSYGTAIYGTSKYSSKAGKPFREIKFQINNRVGKILKMRFEHSSSTEDFRIHKIVFRYAVLGQRN